MKSFIVRFCTSCLLLAAALWVSTLFASRTSCGCDSACKCSTCECRADKKCGVGCKCQKSACACPHCECGTDCKCSKGDACTIECRCGQ